MSNEAAEYLRTQIYELSSRVGSFNCDVSTENMVEMANIVDKMLDVMAGILAVASQGRQA